MTCRPTHNAGPAGAPSLDHGHDHMTATIAFPDIADFPAPRPFNCFPAPVHVGWLEITQPYEHTNTFETASWYEKVAVEPQIVPIYRCRDGSNRFYSAGPNGILTDSHFVNRVFQYTSVVDNSDKIGKPATAQGSGWDQFALYRETLFPIDGRRVHLLADAEELFPDYVREHVDTQCRHCGRHHDGDRAVELCEPAAAEARQADALIDLVTNATR